MHRLAMILAALAALAAPAPASASTEPSYEQIRQNYARSYSYEQAHNYKDAIKALLLLHASFPQGYTVNLRLGWLYYASGAYANSLQHYETAIKALPAAIEPKLGYTLPLLAEGRYQDAEAVTRQVLAIDPSNFYGNLRYIQALRYQGKLEQAAKIAGLMLVLYPTDVGFLVELGLAKAALKDEEGARKVFGDILILDPENVTARKQLGLP